MIMLKDMHCSKRFAPDVITTLKDAIYEAEGQEVLAVGVCNPEGLVTRIEVAARGSHDYVPALKPYMEKGNVVIHNHPSGKLRASVSDLSVASELGNIGIGFFIIDNQVEKIYVVAEPVLLKEKKSIVAERLTELISKAGPLGKYIEGYEPRNSQILLLEAVTRSFNEDGICVAEAGTGVGKSLAYLIPAFDWANRNEERVVISTATINLQHQLIDQDIPLVQKLLKLKTKAVLVKGRGNYLCHRRLLEELEEASLFREENDELKKIQDWSRATTTGSRSDLPFYPKPETWSRICSETDSCLGLRCNFREKCFVLKARREAADARILIVNHHLLFSDLGLRLEGAGFDNTAVLPPFQRLIFDEAHNIEKSATSYFSRQFSKFTIQKFTGRLYFRRRGRTSGLVQKFKKYGPDSKLFETLPEDIESLRDKTEFVNDLALEYLSGKKAMRMELHSPLHDVLMKSLKEMNATLTSLINRYKKILDLVPDGDSELPEVYEGKLLLRRLENIAAVCESFTRMKETEEQVFWLEQKRTSRGEGFTSFIITPIDITGLMREAVFEPYPTVVCTSATLSVAKNFTFWLKRVGLLGFQEERVRTDIFPSPFPYKKRVLLCVPDDAPDPGASEYQIFVSDFVERILELSEGKALVLFTSYSMLKQSYEDVSPRLKDLGITALMQGSEDRSRLLTRFRTDTASVLFATDSFWEGIDAPGDALQVVIICKLPFRVPTDPVHLARIEAIQKRGGVPFMELSLPEAVMKLKQGFGRLMRRRTDGGVVFILDPRVIRKSYGKAFISSLPETRVAVKGQRDLLNEAEEFLFSTDFQGR